MPRLVLLVALVVPWGVALWAWPSLPERFPIHFDAAGRPDGWVTTSALAWFALPALGTVVAAALGLGLPKWMASLARANSPWLNVPNKRAFAALPEAARVRAVAGPGRWLVVLAVAVQALLGWIVYGSARVAAGAWPTLPSWPSWALIGAVLGCAVLLAFAGTRAVRREVERAGG